MNKYFCFGHQENLDELSSVEEALHRYEAGNMIWLNFISPARADLEKIIKPLGLHPLAIEDCLDDEQIPKVENYPSNSFILFNMFSYLSSTVSTTEVNIFVGKNFLVLIDHNPDRSSHFIEKISDIVRQNLAQVAQGTDFLLHVILDEIVDRKFHTLETIEGELDELEECVIRDDSAFYPEHLMKLRRNLLQIRRSIMYEREILVKICRRDSPFISEKAIYHFRDIYDHLTKFYETSEILREMISNLMEIYLSMMNNRMSLIANRTNKSMQRLTFITTIFMPLTLIAGIFGMSEWSMMTGTENWRFSYPLFFGLMIIIGVLNFLLLRSGEKRDDR